MRHDDPAFFAHATWRKSTYSQPQQDCVEVAVVEHTVGVRDTKEHGVGPTLMFGVGAWAAFVNCVRNGEFDTGL